MESCTQNCTLGRPPHCNGSKKRLTYIPPRSPRPVRHGCVSTRVRTHSEHLQLEITRLWLAINYMMYLIMRLRTLAYRTLWLGEMGELRRDQVVAFVRPVADQSTNATEQAGDNQQIRNDSEQGRRFKDSELQRQTEVSVVEEVDAT